MKKKSKDTNEFLTTAMQLIEFVGINNFDRIANCMSRVRFYVNDWSLVNEVEIKKLALVKGINWNGNELQVIIGMNAFKVREHVESLKTVKNNDFSIDKSKVKVAKSSASLGQRFIGAANGIIVPLIPLLIAAGIISGLSAIMVSLGWIQAAPLELAPELNPKHIPVSVTENMDWFSGIIYILTNTGLALLSVFFCYSTVKFMRGDPVIGIFIGFLIASSFFFKMFSKGVGVPGEWKLFEIGDFPITIKGYNNNIIPAVGTGALYVYIDRFIRKWMPGSVDIVFRPVLAIILTFFIAFLFLLPILGAIELIVQLIARWIFGIPFGIGGGIFGFFFLPLMMFGMGWPVGIALELEAIQGDGTVPFKATPITDAAILAMYGTMIALYLKQVKLKDKLENITTMGPMLFGVPEPALYGILIRKPKLFWLGNIGSAIAGLLIAGFEISRPTVGGYGILALIGHGTDYFGMLYFLGISVLASTINFMIVFFFYDEKKSEIKLLKNSLNYIRNYVWINNYKKAKANNLVTEKVSRTHLKNELKEILAEAKLYQKKNNDYYKFYLDYQKLMNQLERKNKVMEHKKQNLITKIDQTDNLKLQEKWNNEILKLENPSGNNLNEQISDKLKELNVLKTEILKINEGLFLKVENLMINFLNKYQATNFQEQLLNKLWNNLNDNLIVSEHLEPKDDQISKTDFYQTEKKWLLKFLPKTF